MNQALRDSYQFCDDLSRREAKNFYHSFRLLPPEQRLAMSSLYAFLRHTDDLADEAGTTEEKQRRIDAWRTSLDAALAGTRFDWPGLLALWDLVESRQLPRRYLVEVIDGVEMDLTKTNYATFDELYRYCYHVASAVGISCLYVWGFRSDGGRAEHLAEANGIALQLTNILRDVREDARNGRVYLPQEDLDRFKVDPASLREGGMTPELRELFAFQASRARVYYEKAAPLASLVEPAGRPVLATITGIYRALLDEIVKRGYNVLDERVRVPSWKKALIAGRAWLARSRAGGAADPASSQAEPTR